MRYSGAEAVLADFAVARGIPMAETIAGKGGVVHDHPAYVGAMGIEGTDAAKELAETADVVIAIGTRLQDFTTGSWTGFARDARFININAARFDAGKHRSVAVVGDALVTLQEISAALGIGHARRRVCKSASALCGLECRNRCRSSPDKCRISKLCASGGRGQ